MENKFDILIIGGGLIGKTAAIVLSELPNVAIALVDKRDIFNIDKASRDGRAMALSAASLNLFENLNISLSKQTQIMRDMLITDGGVGEDPSWRLHFDNEGAEVGAPHMIENEHLNKSLMSALKQRSNITIFSESLVKGLEHTIEGVCAEIGGKVLKADLLVAADGANSFIRTQAGLVLDGRDYDQHALVTTIRHSLSHDGLALQRFLPGGPLAVLPLPDSRSQIVWSDKPTAIEAALELSEDDFITELSHRIGGHLGDVSLAAPRQSYPLRLQLAQNYVGNRLVLIGDAAHVIHPLAGQGLNLGLRDIAALYDVLLEARKTGRDIGGAVLGEYQAWRKSDVTGLAGITDMLSYIYSSPRGFLRRPLSKALGHIRRLGLSFVNDTDVLKKLFIIESTGVTGNCPHLLKD